MKITARDGEHSIFEWSAFTISKIGLLHSDLKSRKFHTAVFEGFEALLGVTLSEFRNTN